MKLKVKLGSGFSLQKRIKTGRLLAYKVDRKIRIHQLASDRVNIIFDDKQQSLECPLAWSRDGETLYHSYDQVYAINVIKGTKRSLTAFNDADKFSVIWFLSVSKETPLVLFRQMQSMKHISKAARVAINYGQQRVSCVDSNGKDYRVLMRGSPKRRPWRVFLAGEPERIFIEALGKNGYPFIWSMRMDGTNLRSHRQIPQAIDTTLSPCGKYLAYSDKGLCVMTLETGKIRKISSFGQMPSWSPDGRQIAFLKGESELWTIELKSKQFQKIIASTNAKGGQPWNYAVKPVWSSDGHLLWFRLTQAIKLSQPTRQSQKWLIKMKDLNDSERRKRWQELCWDYKYPTGVIDFQKHAVWLREGYWSDVAWQPIS